MVIRATHANAKPGTYVLKVDRILSLEENGRRMAEKNYPPALQSLWKAYLSNPKAVLDFIVKSVTAYFDSATPLQIIDTAAVA